VDIFYRRDDMNYQVIYFSRRGSTKKIADAIASELKIEAEDVKNATLDDSAFVFLGSGNYGGRPGKEMITFIEENDFNNVALFGTSGGGMGKEVEEMEKQLHAKNVTVVDRFFCKGKFGLINRTKPSDEDIAEVKKFAKKLLSIKI
jgi:flavodoxin